MKNPPRAARLLLLLPWLALLAGCCANDTYDCQDLQQDSIYLRLNLNQDPTPGRTFSKSDIDTIYLLRYAKSNRTRRRATDSVSLVRATRWSNSLLQGVLTSSRDSVAGLNDKTVLVLNNTSPFPASGPTGKLNEFNYALLVAPNRRGPRYAFRIDSVYLSGQFKGDGCRTCYQNTNKRVKQGQVVTDVTETDGVPKPLLFVKP